eukprot:1394303-Amorphochlora_amoeboformis.AAC.1
MRDTQQNHALEDVTNRENGWEQKVIENDVQTHEVLHSFLEKKKPSIKACFCAVARLGSTFGFRVWVPRLGSVSGFRDESVFRLDRLMSSDLANGSSAGGTVRASVETELGFYLVENELLGCPIHQARLIALQLKGGGGFIDGSLSGLEYPRALCVSVSRGLGCAGYVKPWPC